MSTNAARDIENSLRALPPSQRAQKIRDIKADLEAASEPGEYLLLKVLLVVSGHRLSTEMALRGAPDCEQDLAVEMIARNIDDLSGWLDRQPEYAVLAEKAVAEVRKSIDRKLALVRASQSGEGGRA